MTDAEPPRVERREADHPAAGAARRAGRRGVRARVRRNARLKVGRVLSRGLGIWFRTLGPFLALALLVFLPLIAYAAWVLYGKGATSLEGDWIVVYGTQFLGLVVTATVVYGVFQRLRGRRPGLEKSFRNGMSRILPVIGVTLLMFFALGVFVAFPIGVLVNMDSVGTSALALVFMVLGLYLFCGWWVIVPVAVVEKPGIGASLRRSWRLTRGVRGSVFLIVFAMGLLQALFGAAVGGAGALFLDARGQGLALLGAQIVALSLSAVIVTVGYYDLRVSVEGVDAEQLAAVFD